MTMVDLDFEEQLKETNFPDLLDGDPSQQPKKKESSSRRKIEKEGKQLEEMKYKEGSERRSKKKPVNITTRVNPAHVEVHPQVMVSPSKRTKQSRVAVDPPVSPASGLTSMENKSKHSTSSSSKLTASNIEKLLTPPLEGAVDGEGKKIRFDASKIQKNEKSVKKLTHKSIKRDFIEQVSYDNVENKKADIPVSTVPSQAIFKDNSPTVKETVPISFKKLKTPETLSPKPHGINELEFEHRINSKSSSVSSIPHDGSHVSDDDKEGNNADNVLDEKKASPDEAHDLLERARDRIARQRLVEQVKALDMIVERKNTDLEQLSGQLRRAVETKSDLVIAHNEIEKRHAIVVEKKEQNLLRMKQANIWLLEAQSIKEKELLNEIIRLTDMTRDVEEKRREELDDWERMHRNEMLEKDYMIARLSEELRKLGVGVESPIFKQQQRNNQKGYSYDPTSIITGASKFFFN